MTGTITSLLIANRGEIACRVIRTARRLGIRTVAVFSDADRDAMHVAMADEAVRIGPAAGRPRATFAATASSRRRSRTGAEAIHPGYGFLSENPDFVDQLETAGLIFVGPSASAIRAMGLKDAAKKLMQEAGVPVVPGYHGEAQDPDFLARGGGADRLSRADQGAGRRRRQGHAPRRRPDGFPGRAGRRAAGRARRRSATRTA